MTEDIAPRTTEFKPQTKEELEQFKRDTIKLEVTKGIVQLFPNFQLLAQALRHARDENVIAHITLSFHPSGVIAVQEPVVVPVPKPAPAAEPQADSGITTELVQHSPVFTEAVTGVVVEEPAAELVTEQPVAEAASA